MAQQHYPQPVVVRDVQMGFGSMVVFMVKWAIAAIPAAIILTLVSAVLFSILIALTGGAGTLLGG